MEVNTASQAISLGVNLEEKSGDFYRALAQRYPQNKELFLSFAEENAKNVAKVKRAYYGVITDALEGCFSFTGLSSDDYSIKTDLPEGIGYPGALRIAIATEEKIIKFYSDAAEKSKALMADVPRAFLQIAKKRGERISKLRSLVEKG